MSRPDQKELESLIKINVSIINSFINYKKGSISIHINSNIKEDYGRSAFTLFALSYAYKWSQEKEIDIGLNKEDTSKLLVLYAEILSKSKKENISQKDNDILYVLIYGIRMMNALNLSYADLLEELSTHNLGQIYTYPVLTYIYMSMYKECDLRHDKFLESVFMSSSEVFEYIMSSNLKDKYLPFHFAELSYVDHKLGDMASRVMDSNIDNYLSLDANAYSSGVAKCLEHYARVSDEKRVKKCLDFLDSRLLESYSEHIRPDLLKVSQHMYAETSESQYVCLDTNTHLMLSYINMYENYK
jgi:hypothetical protein